MKKTNLWKQITGLVFALAMIIAAFVVVSPEAVKAADYSFKNSGKSSVTITDEQCSYVTGELAYIKIKPKADGYLKLKFVNASNLYTYAEGKVQLYNAKKTKVLSPIYSYNTNYTDSDWYTEIYGMKKNTTYYVTVMSSDGVKINAEYKKVSDKSGSKKSKAKSLKKKKTTTGLITAGSSAADWYKFSVTSSQKLRVNITPYLTDDIKVTLSGPGVRTNTFTIDTTMWGKKDEIYTYGKVRTGTYYVKVQPATKTGCSGYYKISWK